jgi:guanylate kinase
MKTDFSDIKKYRKLGSMVIISGASGTGKSTICKAIIASNSNIEFSVSCTTRPPRNGEVEGKDYFFINTKKFNELVNANEFIEYANVHGNYYGTLKSEVLNRLNTEKNVLLDIDVQGAMIIKKKFKNDPLISKCVEFIFILPNSLSELEKRLRNRNADTEEDIQKRLKVAKSEIDHFPSYDYLIINDNLNKAISDMQSIVNSFECKTNRLFL